MNKQPRQKLSFYILRAILRLVKKKPTIINRNERLEQQAIFISNHSAANGPITLSAFFPVICRPWGIHLMNDGWKARWNYLYHTFYQQKLKYRKGKAFIMATLLSVISGLAYYAIRLIPSYTDYRLKKTLEISLEHLAMEQPILIFPEDSADGYHEVLKTYFPGFVVLAKAFYQRHKQDIPIYTVYFHSKKNIIVIDKPCFLHQEQFKDLNKEEIAAYFKNRTNELGQSVLKEKEEK